MLEILKKLLKVFIKVSNATCDGAYVATADNDNNLPHFGYFEVRGDAGTVHAITVQGEEISLEYASGEVSRFRISKLLEDSSATNIVIYW